MKKRLGSCLITVWLSISLSVSVQASEVCEMILNGCPESYNGDTLIVPENVVALSSSMMACSTSIESVISTMSPPPSIMFVIDHSSSMSGSNNSNDAEGARFTVTKEFIDSIYAKQPASEVGVVVFAGHLFFNTKSSEYYTKYFQDLPDITDSVSPNQAYVKMLKLDSLYDGKKGIDILKDVLATKDSVVITSRIGRDTTTYDTTSFTELVYQPDFRRSGTDINLAFYAAKDAFKNAKNPKDRQFVIFFSDGEPNGTVIPDVSDNDFTSGTDMATTFTVYFTSSGNAPTSIQTMTNNIKVNGYSEANENSDLWAIQANHDALLKLLMSEAMESILIPGTPSHMVINGISSLSASDSVFQFENKFALTNEFTSFNAQIVYEFAGTDDSKKDSIINLNFVVQRKAGAAPRADISTNCWEQPSLEFYYDNKHISEASEDMQNLQIRLTPNEETVTAPASVEIKSSLESMPVTVTKNGSYWEVTFTRATALKSSDDAIMQHISGDSLIAIYRNPNLPLDTVRVAIHVKVHPRVIPVTAITRDTSGDGHIDRIDIAWLKTDSINIKKTLPAVADFVLNSQISITENSTTKLTPVSVKMGNGDTIYIVVKENTDTTLETEWVNAIVLLSEVAVTEQGNSFNVEKVLDGVGPLIKKILYYPGNDLKPNDTLRISFSEPLNCSNLEKGSPATAFNYFNTGKIDTKILQGASFKYECESGFVKKLIIILNSRGLVKPGADSMNIVGNSPDVSDKNSNLADPDNRIVPVEWGVDNFMSIGVSNNPFDPGKADIAPEVRNYYGVKGDQKYGTIVGITTIKPFDKRPDGSYGSAVIYDALGNIIAKDKPVQKEKVGSNYYIFWDGRNENNRLVANGTYLLMLSGTIEGIKYVDKMKIGVKR